MTEEDHYEEERQKSHYEEQQRIEAAKQAAHQSSDFLVLFANCSTIFRYTKIGSEWRESQYTTSGWMARCYVSQRAVDDAIEDAVEMFGLL